MCDLVCRPHFAPVTYIYQSFYLNQEKCQIAIKRSFLCALDLEHSNHFKKQIIKISCKLLIFKLEIYKESGNLTVKIFIYFNLFRIEGGDSPPPPSIFFKNSKSNQDSLFIFSDFLQNRIRNLLAKIQGHRPYLGLSTAFFPT